MRLDVFLLIRGYHQELTEKLQSTPLFQLSQINFENSYQHPKSHLTYGVIIFKRLFDIFNHLSSLKPTDDYHTLIFTVAFISFIHYACLICIGSQACLSNGSSKRRKIRVFYDFFLGDFCQNHLGHCIPL